MSRDQSGATLQPSNPRGYLAGNLYTAYQDIKDIREVINGYQEHIDQILIKYLTDF